MAGIPRARHSEATLSRLSIEILLIPGIASTGIRILLPSIKNTGYTRSSTVSLFSLTSRRENKFRRDLLSLISGYLPYDFILYPKTNFLASKDNIHMITFKRKHSITYSDQVNQPLIIFLADSTPIPRIAENANTREFK